MRHRSVSLLLFCWFLWPLMGCGQATPSLQTGNRRYQITDLGRSSGLPLFLNNRAEIAAYEGFEFVGKDHAALYRNGQWQDLGTLGGVSSYATGINDQGEVCGFSYRPYVPDNITFSAFVWRSPQLVDLGELTADPDIRATGINNAGQIVGTSRTLGGFLWEKGVFTPLPFLPRAINNKSQVIGQADLNRPVLWQQGQIIPLEPLASAIGGGAVEAINGKGQVVGTIQMPAAGGRDGFRFAHACVWQNGRLQDLGTLGGTGSQALSINNRGEIVGNADTPTIIQTGFGPNHLFHAFLYRDGKMLDLNSLLPPGTDWELHQATSINDLGQIVGYGYKGGDLGTHAYLLSPR